MYSDKPNLLFFLADQHRHDWLGNNPALPLRTPHLDALAERGMRFTDALCPSPFCAPSRACLASGLYYERCGVPDNDHDYPLDLPTYYAALRESGYFVAGVGKFDLHKSTPDWGLDGSHLLSEWGFSEGIDNEGKWDAITSGSSTPKGPYMAYLHEHGLAEMHVQDFGQRRSYRDTHPTPLPDHAYCDNWIAENGLHLLQKFSKDQPWHLVVNFTGPHEPMDITQAMWERWKDIPFPLPHDNGQWDAATHQRIRQNYAAMIENIDRHVGRYLSEVEARDELDNTLIVYSSDHGEMLGDHGLWEKKTYHHPSVGIPLVIAGPGVQQGVVSGALVSLHDLAATFLDYAGLAPLPDMDSRSVRGLLEGERKKHREVVISALDDWRMIYDGRYKLIERESVRPILFDLANDPMEEQNIVDQATGEVNRLRGVFGRTVQDLDGLG